MTWSVVFSEEEEVAFDELLWQYFLPSAIPAAVHATPVTASAASHFTSILPPPFHQKLRIDWQYGLELPYFARIKDLSVTEARSFVYTCNIIN